jgi:hypothetical protein
MSTDQATQSLLNQTNPDHLIKQINEEKEIAKSFTFRNLDPTLHTTWKTCAAMAGVSMEEFGAAAIKEYVRQSIEKSSKQD